MKTGDKVIVPAEINGYGRDLRAIVTEIEKFDIPIRTTAREVKIPMIHSNLPCPKGCIFPLPYLAIWNPKSVIKDIPASDRLLNPSAEMATEWLKNPIIIFSIHKNRFRIIPTTLDKEAYLFFAAVSEKYSLFLKQSFISNDIIMCFLQSRTIIQYCSIKKGTGLKTDSRQIHF